MPSQPWDSKFLSCLRPRPSVDSEHAKALLLAYRAPDPAQEEVRSRMLVFLQEHGREAFLRTCSKGHFTAASLLIDPERGQALLTYHRKLQRWLQFGGHCDGDTNFSYSAWRETHEESGIEPLAMSALPIDLDIHRIPARGAEGEHWHLDVRYLTLAPPRAAEIISEESSELGWFSPAEAERLNLDDSVRRLFRLCFEQRH